MKIMHHYFNVDVPPKLSSMRGQLVLTRNAFSCNLLQRLICSRRVASRGICNSHHRYSAADSNESPKIANDFTPIYVTQINDHSANHSECYTYLHGKSNISKEGSAGPVGSKESAHLAASIFNKATKYFLPRGYPHSVAPGYMQFAIGQSLSIMLSTIGGVLSMQSLLYAMGLSSSATVVGGLAGSINWVLKDGLGQLGGILFASLVSNKFDADPKKWRFVASLAMDASSFIELLSPLAPRFFLLIASVANVGKNIAFLAASASRAAIHKSFDIHENLADITAKTGSQSIVSSMLGTTIGVAVAANVGNPWSAAATSSSTTAASDAAVSISELSAAVIPVGILESHPWLNMAGIFLTCSALSLASTNWSLKHVTIRSLTPHRLDLIIDNFCNNHSNSNSGLTTSLLSSPRYMSELDSRNIMSPSQFSNIEKSVFQGYFKSGVLSRDTSATEVRIGEDFNKFVLDYSELNLITQIFKDRNYLMKVDQKDSISTIYLSFLVSATKKDILHGLIHAYLIKYRLIELEKSGNRLINDQIVELLKPEGSFVFLNDCLNKNTLSDANMERHCMIEYIYNRLLSAHSTNHNALEANSKLGWIVEEMMLETKFARIKVDKGSNNNSDKLSINS